MKKDKKRFKEVFSEAFGEIVLFLILFGIGALILWLFGLDWNAPNIDGDLIVLIGIIVPLVVFGIVSALVDWIKKKIKGKRK